MSADAFDFRWVDDGLGRLGLALDVDPRDLPSALRGAAPTVTRLMRGTLAMIDDAPLWASATKRASAPSGAWEASVGRLDGGPAVYERTVLRATGRLDRAGFAKFAIDDAMLDVAHAWDETFVEGAFTHVLTRDGRSGRIGDVPFAGLAVGDVAKVMRWIFAVPGMARRELVSVYVPHDDARASTCCYFPVRGPSVPAPVRAVRARLRVPCLDRALFDGARCTAMEHFASADLGGWMPSAFTRSGLYARAFLSAAKVEADHLEALFSGAGREGEAFARIARRDGTRVT